MTASKQSLSPFYDETDLDCRQWTSSLLWCSV